MSPMDGLTHVVHGGHGEKRRDALDAWGARSGNRLIRGSMSIARLTIAQHDDLRAAFHGRERLVRKSVQGGL